MKHFLTLLLFISVALGGIAPYPASATTSIYPTAITESNNQIQNESHLLGAPDQLYADLRTNGASVLLDFGSDSRTTGDITIVYETFGFQAQLEFTFYDMNQAFLYSTGGIVPVQNTWTISYPLEAPYRYVRIKSNHVTTVRIDTIASEINHTETPSTPLDNEPEEVIDANPLAGSLIKTKRVRHCLSFRRQ